MRDEALILAADIVESLARVSHTYHCALVDDQNMVEQADGNEDLERTVLPDKRSMYTFARNNVPKQDADDSDGRTVLALMQRVEGSLWFKARDDFELFAMEVEGVSDADGMALADVDELFMSGELAASFYHTVVSAD